MIMLKILVGLFLCPILLSAKQYKIVPSIRASDGSDNNWKNYAELYKTREDKNSETNPPDSYHKSAYSMRVKGSQIPFVDFPKQPVVTSQQELETFFLYARTLRYLDDPSVEGFLRRMPWLYPVDGCFLRALMVSQLLLKEFQQATGRVFIFGNLTVPSPEAGHTIQWWYHTAATLQLGETTYVIDIAIEPMRPLTLEEWVKRQGIDDFKNADIALCEANTYFPNQDCIGSDDDTSLMTEHTPLYLKEERNFLTRINANNPDIVEKLLGETPPWLNNEQ